MMHKKLKMDAAPATNGAGGVAQSSPSVSSAPAASRKTAIAGRPPPPSPEEEREAFDSLVRKLVGDGGEVHAGIALDQEGACRGLVAVDRIQKGDVLFVIPASRCVAAADALKNDHIAAFIASHSCAHDIDDEDGKDDTLDPSVSSPCFMASNAHCKCCSTRPFSLYAFEGHNSTSPLSSLLLRSTPTHVHVHPASRACTCILAVHALRS